MKNKIFTQLESPAIYGGVKAPSFLTGFTVISLLVAFTLVFASFCFAEKVKVRVLEGIIEHVTDDSIRVRGNYYDIAHVPLKNASEETLPKSYLNQGKKVEIFFHGNKIASVLVHEYMLE